jgi:hypothetical protein
MLYCIFLKSLRILEESRKNPCVKIPPKSPCVNFQSLGKFKNPIFISKRISLQFRPSWPSCPASLFGLSVQWPSTQHLERLAYRADPPTVDPFPSPFSNSSRHSCRHLPDASPMPCAPPPLSPWHHGAPTTRTSSSLLDPLINGPQSHPPPLDSGNRRFQIEASTPATEGTRPTPPRLRPIKGRPTPDEDPHPSNSPPPSPHHSRTIAILS